MSVSRDDFSIAFRSALLQRGGAQKFSVLSLIFLALIIFFLDVYGVKFTKPVRSFLNDVVYRVTFLASTPTRFVPQAGKDISNFFNVKEENERLKLELEKYKSLELNVEFLTDENKNLQKINSLTLIEITIEKALNLSFGESKIILSTDYLTQELNLHEELLNHISIHNINLVYIVHKLPILRDFDHYGNIISFYNLHDNNVATTFFICSKQLS